MGQATHTLVYCHSNLIYFHVNQLSLHFLQAPSTDLCSHQLGPTPDELSEDDDLTDFYQWLDDDDDDDDDDSNQTICEEDQDEESVDEMEYEVFQLEAGSDADSDRDIDCRGTELAGLDVTGNTIMDADTTIQSGYAVIT